MSTNRTYRPWSRRQSKAVKPEAKPPAFSLNPSAGKQFAGSFDADAARSTGEAAGDALLHREETHGKENAERAKERFPTMLSAVHKTLIQTVGTQFRLTIQPFREALADVSKELPHARQRALDAIETWAEESRRLAEREFELKLEGLYLPHRAFLIILAAVLVGLLAADWTMLPLSFSSLNLSDSPMLGIPGVDELHIAASGVLVGLVVLAHRSMAELRTILSERALERRTPKDKRAKLPDKDEDAAKLGIAFIAFALVLIAGLTWLRVSYLRTIQQPTNAFSFLAVNVGILGACLVASLWYAHPKVKEFRSSLRRFRSAEKTMSKAVRGFREQAGENNKLLERISLHFALAAQLVRASASDSVLMQATYEFGVLYGQPEPTEALLFLKSPALPAVLRGVEELLFGGKVPKAYKVVDTEELDPLIELRRGETLALRAKLEAQDIELIGAVNSSSMPDVKVAMPEKPQTDEKPEAPESWTLEVPEEQAGGQEEAVEEYATAEQDAAGEENATAEQDAAVEETAKLGGKPAILKKTVDGIVDEVGKAARKPAERQVSSNGNGRMAEDDGTDA